MVFTSALIRPTALLQLAHLAVGQPASALASELGHLTIGTPDEGGQISATEACLPHQRLRHGLPNRRPAGASSPCCGNGPVPLRGVVEHLQRVRETDAKVSVWSGRDAVESSSLAIRGGGHRVPAATRR